MAKKLKVGIIGIGGIARTHLPGWQASEHAELVAAADINAAALDSFGKANGISRLYTDTKDMFADKDLDIIDLCVPNMMHAPLAIAAMKAGKHVICEKPLAPTPELIRKMIKTRDESKRMLMTAQHFRFAGVSRAMKNHIQSGALGEIYHARSWMLRRSGMVPLPSFTKKSNSGGGPTIDIGVHVLDLTLWLMGHPRPVAVSGVAKQTFAQRKGLWSHWRSNLPMPEGKDFDVEDFAAAFVRFESGATLMLEVSWFMHHDNLGEDMQIWIYGREGGAHWPKAEFLSTDYDSRQYLNTTLKSTRDEMEPHALECVEFARAIADGRPSPVPAEDSLKVLTILDGIYKSQSVGKEVRLRA
jgi:predicted dehydrogenase